MNASAAPARQPAVIAPGAWLGLLGGGQLGRMFAMAAQSMGYRVAVVDPGGDSPAGSVADRHIRADYLDPSALAELATLASAVTTEFENVPAQALEFLARRCRVSPDAASVAIAQDRISEKTFLSGHGLQRRALRGAAERGRCAGCRSRAAAGHRQERAAGLRRQGAGARAHRRRRRRRIRGAGRRRLRAGAVRRPRLRGLGDRRPRRGATVDELAGRREPASRRHPRRLDRPRPRSRRDRRPGAPHRGSGRRAPRLPRRALRRDVRHHGRAAAWSTKWRRARTTAATTRSTPA